jgi:hypothetical protein
MKIQFVLFSILSSVSFARIPKFLFTAKSGVSIKLVSAFTEEFGLVQISHSPLPLVFLGDKPQEFSDSMLEEIFDIEQDETLYLLDDHQVIFGESRGAWHLGRISQRNLLPDSTGYPFNSTGSCHTDKNLVVDTYVLDTGIDVTHPQFQGRAIWLKNFADSKDTDCNSHGTHCAGLIGSKDYGVCKDARLFAVKVLNCQGSGAYSGVIAGIDYIFKRHSEQKVISIVSMSLGGPKSSSLDRVISAAITKSVGLHFVVAAGNENDDACETSPANIREAITVMASDYRDSRAVFSNYGKCADQYAPGVDILPTIPGDGTAIYSGTSMATPIVAGALNIIIHRHPTEGRDYSSLKKILTNSSTPNKIITNHSTDDNNKLVYIGSN